MSEKGILGEATATASGRTGSRRLLRLSARLGGGACAAYVGLVVLLVLMEDGIVYPAPRYPAGDWSGRGTGFEDVTFTSADGTRLNGRHFTHAEPIAHVLYLHGNGEHVAHVSGLTGYLRDRVDASVFAFDYRGYGRSEGVASEAGLVADGRAARAWLARRAGIRESDIVLMGRSLGGGVAVALAAELPPRGLVLESTFTSLPDVAAAHYPWVPVRLVMRNRFNSLSKIAEYDGPLLQSHGEHDRIIPFELGRTLHRAAPGPKQFFLISGGRHNEPQPDEYYDALERFLRECATAAQTNEE